MNEETRVAKDFVLNISSKSDFNDLLESILFTDEEKKIMKMIYVDGKEQSYIYLICLVYRSQL